jgi:hypothetical protein
LRQILEDYNTNSINLTSQKFKDLQDQFRQANPQANGAIGVPNASDVIMEAEGGFQTFHYNNGYFAVPEGFKFPTRLKLREALRFLLLGQVVSEDGQRKVRPFQKYNRRLCQRI